MKLFEIEFYKACAAMELEHKKQVEEVEVSMREPEDSLDSAMEEGMEEFRRFEETKLLPELICQVRLGQRSSSQFDFICIFFFDLSKLWFHKCIHQSNFWTRLIVVYPIKSISLIIENHLKSAMVCVFLCVWGICGRDM